MYDLLLSADMMVPDPDGMADLLTEKLGIHQHPNWRQAFDNHPYIAHFLRVHKSLALAPTRVEPQWHLDKPNPGDPLFHDFLESLLDFQGRHRPMVTHSVVLTMKTAELDKLIERLMSRRVPNKEKCRSLQTLPACQNGLPELFSETFPALVPERCSHGLKSH